MISVGPSLPPELLAARKRKRDQQSLENTGNQKARQGEDETVHGTKVVQSARSEDHASGQVALITDVDRRSSRDESSGSQEEDEEDETIGPMLPQNHPSSLVSYEARRKDHDELTKAPISQVQSGRPDWMICPPSGSDWTKNIDTTSLKSRSFATQKPGRPSISASHGIQQADAWTKVPGQTATTLNSKTSPTEETEKVRRRHDDEQRGKSAAFDASAGRARSLYDQHNEKRQRTGADMEDASHRPFDREKDIVRNSSLQKTRQMASNSKHLSTMFDTGKFL